jgi:tetratricopeptide (TPR) repeat protein
MPRSSSHIIALLLAALLSACQSLPEPAPEVMPESVAEVKPVSAGNATTSAAEPIAQSEPVPAEPVPVDLDQQAYEQAIAALKNGAVDKALKLLARLSQDAPDKPRLFTNLGLAHFQLQQAELAEQAFQQAIARDRDDAVAHNHLGILQRRQGRFQEALKEYQRAIKIDSKYAHAHLNLGILFDLYLQDLEKALQQYRKYQKLTSDENTQVAGWIIDIERRLKSTTSKKKG